MSASSKAGSHPEIRAVSEEVAAALPPWQWPRAAYIHIPFCAHHCGYCDFAVATGVDDRIDAYLAALERELELMLGFPRPVQTVFLGGGTPTHLPPPQLERLLRALNHWLPRTRTADPQGHLQPHEFAIEATPESLGPDTLAVLADAGINRVSLGVQSFDPALLAVLERQHSPHQVPAILDRLRARIPNVSLDLIFGVPGQTLAGWSADLDRALALEPCHVSTYGLTYEKGTRLWKQRQRGQVRALDEDTELAMYLEAIERLSAAGYRHYEISNHARPGWESQHNQYYWANWSHFGFGMGAAGYVLGTRTLNTRSLATYIQRLERGERPTFQSETLEPFERAQETITTQLRRAEGIHRQEFMEQTGFAFEAVASPRAWAHVAAGRLLDDGISIRWTKTGVSLADTLIAELISGSPSVNLL